MGQSTVAIVAVGIFALNAILLGVLVHDARHISRHTASIDSVVQDIKPRAERLLATGESFVHFYDSATQLLSGSVVNLANRILRKDYAGLGQNVTAFTGAVKAIVANHTGWPIPGPPDSQRLAAVSVRDAKQREQFESLRKARESEPLFRFIDHVVSNHAAIGGSADGGVVSTHSRKHILPKRRSSPAESESESAPKRLAGLDYPICSYSDMDDFYACFDNGMNEQGCRSHNGCAWSQVYNISDFFAVNTTICASQTPGNIMSTCVPIAARCQFVVTNNPMPCPENYLPEVLIIDHGAMRVYDLPFVTQPIPDPPKDVAGGNYVYAVADLVHSVASNIATFQDVNDPSSVPTDNADNGLILDVADYAIGLVREQLNTEAWVRLAKTCEAFATNVGSATWSGSYVDADGYTEKWDATESVNSTATEIKRWCTLVKNLGS
eukprot:comp21587_c0_seq2/m.47463 comp21587_c0_seq2/g.47463  ORF comp21587_c0_seq2/g.47463 comp21587_c0_seq2/m.47463 type:complete len:438 (-) comp21587_c0_seq2:53-1366(-)